MPRKKKEATGEMPPDVASGIADVFDPELQLEDGNGAGFDIGEMVEVTVNDQPFINCDEFNLVSIKAAKHRVFDVVALADGAKVSDRLNQSKAIVLTVLENLFTAAGTALASALFPETPDVTVDSFKVITKLDKNKDPITTIQATGFSEVGLGGYTIKSKPVSLRDVGDSFADSLKALEEEVLAQIKQNRGPKYVQPSLFDPPAEEQAG